MFWFPLIIIILNLALILMVVDDAPWLSALLAFNIAVQSMSLASYFNIEKGYPNVKEVRVQIEKCEKDLPRELHCKLEIVKP